MRNVLLYALGCLALLLTWLAAGRYLVTLLDQITLTTVERRNLEHLLYTDGVLDLAGTHVDFYNSTYTPLAELSLSPSGQVILKSGEKQFLLGPGSVLPESHGWPKFEFTKDAGDQALCTIEQSRIAWPTPFEMNFMTGHSPAYKRNAYVRLRWTKRNGAKLHILWKTEQLYYRQDGWSPRRIEAMVDGLTEINIQESK